MANLTDEEKVQIARQDFAFYIGWAHKTDMDEVSDGQAVPQPHHVQMIRRMEAVAPIILRLKKRQGQDRHTAIVAPPGSGKTVILQYFYEWMLGLASLYWGEGWAEKFHMGHVSHSESQAKRMSFSVAATVVENDVFRMCFPNVKPSDKWSELEWRVEGCTGLNPTFAALGVGGRWPGFRWNIMGMDDVVNPDPEKGGQLTSTDIETIIFRIEKIGMKRLVVGGCAFLTNTRWFERDPTSWALDQGWTHVLIKALNENAESFWEEREIFSAENLVDERERDPEGFALQFQGEPAPEGGIKFKQEWLKQVYDQLPWTDAEDRYVNFRIVDSWDTAGTTNARSDETAGWKAAIDIRDTPWKLYLLDMLHGKMEYPELMDVLRESFASDLPPDFFFIESKSSGLPASQELERDFGRIVHPVQAYGERGKDTPALKEAVTQTQYLLKQGRVLWPSPRIIEARQMVWPAEARSALLKFPRGHDDIARSFIQLAYEMMKLEASGVEPRLAQPDLTWGRSDRVRAIV